MATTARRAHPATSTTADLGLITPGTLTVASDIPYTPFEFFDPGSTEAKGFDVDLVTAIAKTLGITDVQFVDQSFDGIILAIKQGSFDMSASSWTITPERAEQVDFGDPYFSANQAILVQKDSTVTSLDDLEGKTIGAQRATVGADLAATVPDAEGAPLRVGRRRLQRARPGPRRRRHHRLPGRGVRRRRRSRPSRSPPRFRATWPSG